MSDKAYNERVQSLVNAMLDALDAAATANGSEPTELVLAAQALAVNLAIASSASLADAKAALGDLIEDYFDQARERQN